MAQPQDTDELRVRMVRQHDLTADEDWTTTLRTPPIYGAFVNLPGVKPICSTVAADDDPYVVTVGPKFGHRWFVVKDISDAVLDSELTDWGLTRKQVTGTSARYRIVQGFEWRGPIESKYLARWVRGPGDEPTRTLTRDAGDLAITVMKEKKPPRSARIWEYIRHGEAIGVHEGVYVRPRRENWFCVEQMDRSEILFPYSMQYGHKVWANPGGRKYTTSPSAHLTPRGAETTTALALLNSTWTFLAALFDAGSVGTEGLVRFGGRGDWRRLNVIDPARATPEQAVDLADIWKRMGKQTAHPFPPEGSEPLTDVRRELDELALAVAGVDDPIDASEMVDALYRWLPTYTAERAGVEEMAVAGRSTSGSAVRVRSIVDQVFAAIDASPPWLNEIDAAWVHWDLPDDTPDSSGQGSLFGFDGRIEQPSDIKFGDTWVRFDSESQADFVRTLAVSRMAPRRLALPPAPAAAGLSKVAVAWIDLKQSELRNALAERIGHQDPAYADAFVQSLSRLSAAVRTALHAV